MGLALGLLAVRGSPRALFRRFWLALLLALTLVGAGIAIRGFRGNDPLWTGLAVLLLGPSLVLAWRDYLRAK